MHKLLRALCRLPHSLCGSDVTASATHVQVLCRLLHPPFGLSHPMFLIHMMHVVYSLLLWDVTSSVWGAVSSVHYAQAFCGLFQERYGLLCPLPRHRTKKGNEEI